MMDDGNDSYALEIFVPPDVAAPFPGVDPSAENHDDPSAGGSYIHKFDAESLRQWAQTINRLIEFGASIGAKANDWSADEIRVGFTLSARGKLVFIANAGAKATITVKLKRKTSALD